MEMDAMTNEKYKPTGSAQEDLLRHQVAEHFYRHLSSIKLALLNTDLYVSNLIWINAKNEWMGTHY
jgi:hypothetical protein